MFGKVTGDRAGQFTLVRRAFFDLSSTSVCSQQASICPDTIPAEGDYTTNLSHIAGELKNVDRRLTRELKVVTGALAAFGAHSSIKAGRRKLSTAGLA
jgi:hypothetical protein